MGRGAGKDVRIHMHRGLASENTAMGMAGGKVRWVTCVTRPLWHTHTPGWVRRRAWEGGNGTTTTHR